MGEAACAKGEAINSALDAILFADTNRSKRRSFYLVTAAIVVLICAWLGLRRPISFPLDDAYITLHNAAVLLLGKDENYPGTPALAGATSSIHLALVTAVRVLLSPSTASFIVASGGLLIYALALARLAFEVGGSRFLAGLAVAVGTLSGYAPYHLFNGLETGLAMAAVTWSLVFAMQKRPTWELPVICGLMPFLRPELSALSALLLGRQAWAHYKSGSGAPPILRDVLIATLVAAPWLLWIKWNTGQFVPATVSAKALFFAEAGLPVNVKLLGLVLTLNYMTVVTAYLGFIATRPRSLACLALAFLGIFLFAYYIQLPGALRHNHFRYLQIILPLSLLGMLSSLRVKNISQYLLIFSALWIAVTLPRAWEDYRTGIEQTAGELTDLASWTAANLPPDARILIHDAGYLAYATNFELIDLVGLKTPSSIPFHKQFTAPSTGERRGDAVHRIAMQSRPTHAVILNDNNDIWGNTAGYLESHGWNLQALRPASAPWKYAVFKLTPPR